MEQNKNTVFGTLQKVGQSLMVPVSVLPAAGLMVAIGRMIQKAAEDSAGVVTSKLIHAFGDIFFTGGLAIFEQLPVVFAIGVAIGFTGGAGVAGLAAVVGYFTLTNVLKSIGDIRGLTLAINTGVFGGIAIGLMSAALYKRFFQTKLHPVFGFFSGKRLVPIVTVGAAIVLGLVLGFVWPPIQLAINSFGTYAMGSDLGPAFYAAGKRLLIPVGLHHVYYPPFLFQFGEYVTQAGKVLHGESARYFAGDPTAGRFMASEFPIMLFGLPAATLAMYLRAEKGQRKAVAGIMLSAALTSIVTGITEPIEFAFIFVAPILFVFHVCAAFVSGLLTGFFDIHLGYTFSASAIDYVLGAFNQKNSMYFFALVGPLVGVTYFSVFYTLIGWFNLKTPGRDVSENALAFAEVPSSEKAVEVLKAIGDKANVQSLDACITRLRLSVKDPSKVNQARLKQLGAAGILNAGQGNFQIIFGTESDLLKEEINGIIARGGVSESQAASVARPVTKPQTTAKTVAQAKTSVRSGELMIRSPFNGSLMAISDVPDSTFSDKILGDGFAVDPSEGVVYAPADGKIEQLFRTNHAIGMVTDDGVEILIHVGIDTVKMKGRGFQAFVSTGDTVKAGDKLIEFDLAMIRKEAKSAISPILVTNMAQFKGLDMLKNTLSIHSSEDVMRVRL